MFSLGLFLKVCIAKGTDESPALFAGKTWGKVPLILIALAIYIALLPFAGYLLGTFLFMSFVYRLAGFQRWRWVFVSSFVTTAVTYFVFSFWLGVRFPPGILGV
jgi:hypothetical protein